LTYLVTGAGGFLGSAIVRALLIHGREVVATDVVTPRGDVSPGPLPGARLQTAAYDVTHEAYPASLDRQYEAIIHAAALTLPADQQEADRERLMAVNVGGTAHVLELARATGTPTLVYVSSSGVYRRGVVGLLSESDADGGNSPYGASKLAAEALLRGAFTRTGGHAIVLRPCSLYGTGEAVRSSRPEPSPVWHLATAAAAGQSVRLVRPDSRREWLSVHDAAAAIAMAALRETGHGMEVFNLGTGTLHDLATVAELVGVRVLDDGADRIVDGGDDWAGYLDTTAIKRELGWQPRLSLPAGLAGYVAELAQHDASPAGVEE
jgi:nucleoside-diphosphate-sugar epimerase